MHFEVQNFCFFCPCAGLVHFEVQNLDIFCPGAGFRQGVGLQSRPNLHRDKKNTSFELQRTPNLHRDKKNKKNKNFTIYLGRGDYPSKVFVFFVFFVPVQVWCTLKFKTFVFFVPVQVWCTLKVQNMCFFVPVQVWCTLKFKTHAMHLFICILILFLLLADILDAYEYGIFCFPCSFLKGQVHFSCKGFTI